MQENRWYGLSLVLDETPTQVRNLFILCSLGVFRCGVRRKPTLPMPPHAAFCLQPLAISRSRQAFAGRRIRRPLGAPCGLNSTPANPRFGPPKAACFVTFRNSAHTINYFAPVLNYLEWNKLTRASTWVLTCTFLGAWLGHRTVRLLGVKDRYES